MKKLLLITILIFAVHITANAQNAKFYANGLSEKIIEKTDGFLLESYDEEDKHVYRIEIDSYYDFHLVARIINRIIDSYSDVTFLKRWERKTSENGDYYYDSFVETDDEFVIGLLYMDNPKTITVVGFNY